MQLWEEPLPEEVSQTRGILQSNTRNSAFKMVILQVLRVLPRRWQLLGGMNLTNLIYQSRGMYMNR